ncbi:MAG: hypothetical protein ACRC1H_15475, partial [Caldilineaceae bacterium]
MPLLVYVVLALLLTWPLASRLLTHVPGDGIDDPSLAWNLWWVGERLVQQGSLNLTDLFDVAWMFHPLGINLAFYTLTPLHGLLSVPLQWSVGLTLSANLLLLSTLVLGAYGMYLLALDTLAPLAEGERSNRLRTLWVAALLAGGLYAFAAPKLFYLSLGQFNIAGSQRIPFCALYAQR